MYGSLAVRGAAAQMLVWGQCDGTITRQVQGLCLSLNQRNSGGWNGGTNLNVTVPLSFSSDQSMQLKNLRKRVMWPISCFDTSILQSSGAIAHVGSSS